MRPYIVTIVVILLLISLFAYLVLWKTQEYEGLINIDGDMGDWDGVTRTADALGDTGNANIDIIENAFQIDTVFLSLLTTTAEPIFTSPEGHTLRVLIDSDDNVMTGYALPGIGADHLIEVYGRSLATLSSSGLTNVTVLYTFDDSRDHHDWNGFTAATAVLGPSALSLSFSSSNSVLTCPVSEIAWFRSLITLRTRVSNCSADWVSSCCAFSRTCEIKDLISTYGKRKTPAANFLVVQQLG
jgi:hypothetical protein